MTDMPPSRIAYLANRYPAASHTFILREIAALRREGLDIVTTSTRRPGADELIGPEERAEAAQTFYILDAAKSPSTLLRAHAGRLAKAPRRWFGALGLALSSGRPGLKGMARQLAYFLEAGVLARHLAATGADHIHCHFMHASANLAMITSEMTGLPFSLTLHGPSDLDDPEGWRMGEKIARARFVACISHYARSQAMRQSDPAHWEKLKIVHCGIEPERYAAAEPPEGPLRLLFVGRLAPVKGLRVLYDALETVRHDHPEVTLTLIGDGPERAWSERRAADMGGVTHLGYQSQDAVAAELARAHALVLPSFAEGVPVVLMEAMASARPVIATRVAGVSELVEGGRSGLLVPPGDATTLAHAITRMAETPRSHAAMGRAGRDTVLAEFHIDTEAAWLAEIFKGRAGRALRPGDTG